MSIMSSNIFSWRAYGPIITSVTVTGLGTSVQESINWSKGVKSGNLVVLRAKDMFYLKVNTFWSCHNFIRWLIGHSLKAKLVFFSSLAHDFAWTLHGLSWTHWHSLLKALRPLLLTYKATRNILRLVLKELLNSKVSRKKGEML